MTREEAVTALQKALDDMSSKSGVHVTLDGDKNEIVYRTYQQLGATFDAEELVDEAYSRSHTGSAFKDGWNILRSSLDVGGISPEPNEGWEDKAATILAEAAALEPEDFSYELRDDSVVMTKAKDGRNASRATLKTRLGDAEPDDDGDRSIELPYTVVAAEAGDLEALNASLGGSAANASYDAKTGKIIPETMARHFDVKQAQMLLDAAEPGTQVTVPTTEELPKITAADLEKSNSAPSRAGFCSTRLTSSSIIVMLCPPNP